MSNIRSVLTHLGWSVIARASAAAILITAAFQSSGRAQVPPNAFVVHSYQGRARCLDYTPEAAGSAVFLNDCSIAHLVIVEELNDGKHTVILHAGTKLIGIVRTISTLGWASAASSVELPLTLLNAGLTPIAAVSDDRFLLDGDSIILESSMPEPPSGNPVLVAKVQSARGKVGTPIVIGPRDAADNEFWEFKAQDNSDRDPTSGFIRIGFPGDPCRGSGSCAANFTNLINNMQPGSGFGTVIRLSTDWSFQLPWHLASLPAGLTIRGDRRGTNLGPRLVAPQPDGNESSLFQITGPPQPGDAHYSDYVRITGIRLAGPLDCVSADQSGDPDSCHPNIPHVVHGIEIGNQSNPEPFGVLIDHNSMYNWSWGSLGVGDAHAVNAPGGLLTCGLDTQAGPADVDKVHVYRNSLHHNETYELGYGVDMGFGGAATIFGNTFLMNRHAITADAEPRTQYQASSNLVLSDVPVYNGNREQDFDMHGSAPGPANRDGTYHWVGGDAGGLVKIAGNTFLGGNRDNFELRGKPCYGITDQFNSNTTMNARPVEIYGYSGTPDNHIPLNGPVPSSTPYAVLSSNSYLSANPAGRLAVGDFDGDGSDDLFLATGAAWYYSPGGTAEWRFLNARPEPVEQLLFGDFDGDGRADVVTAIDGHLMVSWGGISDWEVLNTNVLITGSPAQIAAAMAVGNFMGDARADLFLADGKEWWVSDAGQGPFVLVQTSVFQVKDLRFGDFNRDGRTDVFGVGSNNWQVSYAPATGNGLFSSWQPLRAKLTDSADGLIVADFDGDGIADVAMDCSGSQCWKISSGGRYPWSNTPQHSGALGPALAAVGRFSTAGVQDKQVEVLTWNDNSLCSRSNSNELCISHWGGGAPIAYSVQKMR